MTFEDLFLRSQNQDCLGQILSFLTCNELSNTAAACKVLQQTIFEAGVEEADIDLIWAGAEKTMVSERRDNVFPRFGPNARKYCQFFAIASKAAKECELSGETEENRIKVDGILADLMNVRGFDAESVAEKKAIGDRKMLRAVEEAVEEVLENIDVTSVGSEPEEGLEELENLSLPEKDYHHGVFVRITSSRTGKLISEGFCAFKQKFSWRDGLDFSLALGRPQIKQRLEIKLDFQSLTQSMRFLELERFIHAHDGEWWEEEIFGSICRDGLGIYVTAVVIDLRDLSTQCLFQHDRTAENNGSYGVGHGNGYEVLEFPAHPTWSRDYVQLGSSTVKDIYSSSFNLSLEVIRCREGHSMIDPMLVVNVDQELSFLLLGYAARYFASLQANGDDGSVNDSDDYEDDSDDYEDYGISDGDSYDDDSYDY